MYDPAPIRQRRRVPLKEADWYRYIGRLRSGVLVGLTFYFFSRALMAAHPTAGWIMRGIAVLAPLLGILFHDALDALVDRAFRNIFWPQGTETAPAHLYQSIIWKYPDDGAAEDAARRIDRLRWAGLA